VKRVMLIVVGLALAASASAQSRRAVEIAAVDGLPPDSLQRNDFLAGFRSAFEQGRLDREVSGVAGWSGAPAIPNAFQLRRRGADRDAWSVRVSIQLPQIAGGPRVSTDPTARRAWANPKRRLSRGMVVRVAAFTANEARIGSGPEPDEVVVRFPEPGGESQTYQQLGYDFPWKDAGRIAGVLALESLHHRSRDLGARERLALAGWLRTERQD